MFLEPLLGWAQPGGVPSAASLLREQGCWPLEKAEVSGWVDGESEE